MKSMKNVGFMSNRNGFQEKTGFASEAGRESGKLNPAEGEPPLFD
jgi:hypothetical protein